MFYKNAYKTMTDDQIRSEIKTDVLTERDLKVLKYYKAGNELSGFEGVHENLCTLGYLDSDLEKTHKCRIYINEFLKD